MQRNNNTPDLHALLDDPELVEAIARSIYELQPETIRKGIARLRGTMLDDHVDVISFEEATNQQNAIDKAKAAIAAIKARVKV